MVAVLGIVTNTGENTEIGRISAMVAKIQTITTPLLRQMNIFGRWLTTVILLISAITFIIGFFLWNGQGTQMLMSIVAIAVAAIPEGLPAIVTITLAIGVTCMAKRNAIIRHLPAVETMGSVSTICTDKTGTLTRNELAVQNVITSDHAYQITGSGYNPHGKIFINDQEQSIEQHHDLQQTVRAAILCNDAELMPIENEEYKLEGNPIDGALLTLGIKANMDVHFEKQNQPHTDFIPFESEHKFMASLHHDHENKGYVYIKGAPEKILSISQYQLLQGNNVPIDLDYWNKHIHSLATEGKRLVAIAMCPANTNQQTLNFSDITEKFTFLGLFALIDPPREEVVASITKCKEAGINVKMITGDHTITACTIGKQIGIGNGKSTNWSRY